MRVEKIDLASPEAQPIGAGEGFQALVVDGGTTVGLLNEAGPRATGPVTFEQVRGWFSGQLYGLRRVVPER